jgi:hypothetical protein
VKGLAVANLSEILQPGDRFFARDASSLSSPSAIDVLTKSGAIVERRTGDKVIFNKPNGIVEYWFSRVERNGEVIWEKASSEKKSPLPPFVPLGFSSWKALVEDVRKNMSEYIFVRLDRREANPIICVERDRVLDKFSMSGDTPDKNGEICSTAYLARCTPIPTKHPENYGIQKSDHPGIAACVPALAPTPGPTFYVKLPTPRGLLIVANPDKRQVWGI